MQVFRSLNRRKLLTDPLSVLVGPFRDRGVGARESRALPGHDPCLDTFPSAECETAEADLADRENRETQELDHVR